MVNKGSMILLPLRRPDQLIGLLVLLQLLSFEPNKDTKPGSRGNIETGFFLSH